MHTKNIIFGIIAIGVLLIAGFFFYKYHLTNKNFASLHESGNKEMDHVMMKGVKIQTTFENDKVKIVHYHFDPRAKIPMHHAPDLVAVWLTDGSLKLTSPEGTSKQTTVKAGQIAYEAAENHAGENLSSKPLDFISIQLKHSSTHVSPSEDKNAENAMNMSTMTSPGLSIHQEISNDKIEAFRYKIAPGGEIPWHTPPAGVQVQLTNGNLRITFDNGKTIDAVLKAGTAVWFESTRHKGANIGTTPIEFLSIRLR